MEDDYNNNLGNQTNMTGKQNIEGKRCDVDEGCGTDRSAISSSKRKCRLLTTHLWQSKRMHMCEQWGYKLPQHHSLRGIGFVNRKLSSSPKSAASLKRLSQSAFIYDHSYLEVIELKSTDIALLTEVLELFMVSSQMIDFYSFQS
jgi:hypothetical protein